jgi:tRNA threonylcarbamoyl adenosine modification protein YeaZ
MGFCSVSIINKGTSLYHKLDTRSTQSENLFSVIQKLLIESNLSINDIDTIVCSIGPGSFTGIRIAVAATRGIKLARPQINIFGITNTQLLLASTKTDMPKIVLLNAYRDQLYLQQFSKNNSDIELVDIENFQNFYQQNINEYEFVADATLKNILDNKIFFVEINAKLISDYVLKYGFKNLDDCIPKYIRLPDAIPPKRMFDL